MSQPSSPLGNDESVALTSMHVRRAVDGDMQSLGWLVARLSPLLVVHASHRLGSLRHQYDPEDLVHEAWLVILPKLAALQARDGRYAPVLLRYLSSTIGLKINNLLRKQARRGEFGTRSPGTISDADDWDPLPDVPADVTGVVTQALRNEMVDQVRAALDELAEKDREVILLRGIEGESSKAVAMLLNLSPAAVDQRYTRALRRLRVTLPDSVFSEIREG